MPRRYLMMAVHIIYPMGFKLQLGGQLAYPQALTPVSNWGKPVQPTTLQLERRRV